MWENNSESTTVMKKISFLEKDIALRKSLVQKAEDVEVLFEFLNENQVEEEEVKKELNTFSNLLHSVFGSIVFEPGLVDSPPKSIIFAPDSIICEI